MFEWNIILPAIIVACTWSLILTDSEGIFGFIRPFIQGSPGYDNQPERKPLTNNEWIQKLIYGCEKCIAGQISFWSFTIVNWNQYSCNAGLLIILINQAVTVCTAVFGAALLAKFYTGKLFGR